MGKSEVETYVAYRSEVLSQLVSSTFVSLESSRFLVVHVPKYYVFPKILSLLR